MRNVNGYASDAFGQVNRSGCAVASQRAGRVPAVPDHFTDELFRDEGFEEPGHGRGVGHGRSPINTTACVTTFVDRLAFGPRYFIKSFRRSEVRTVNGLPPPK